MSISVTRTALLAAGLMSAVTAPAAAQREAEAPSQRWSEFSLSTGVDYTSGDYGSDVDTDILYVPATARYETENFQFRVTVPWLQIEGPGSVLGGGDGGVVVGGGAPAVTSESGIGDIILAGTVNLYPEADSGLPFAELTAKVKLPTADEDRGLGTGETDFTVQLDVFQQFGAVTPFGTVGYRWRGDPEMFTLEDGFIGSIGVSVEGSEQLSFGAVYDYRESATTFADDTSELVPFVVFSPSNPWSVNVYGVFGLSDGSPDTGGGIQLTRSF